MFRFAQEQLISWKNNKARLPLILQGARQVGKTWLMKWLGETHFKNCVYFNFDERPELKEIFIPNKDIDRILKTLSLIHGTSIDYETLIIFDEIQECPEALATLKYFAESEKRIPIICAGSLLGVLLHPGSSFPVGKVEFLSIYPMSFREVLMSRNEKAAEFLSNLTTLDEIPAFFYTDLIDEFKKYMITGGLPAIVHSFNEFNRFDLCDQLLENLLLSYRGDFSKHPVMKDIAKIGWVFDSLPAQLSKENKKFIFSLVRQGARAKEYEDAIQWLVRSGLVYQIKLIKKPGLPVTAYEDAAAFKLFAMDVGLIRRMSKLLPSVYAEGNRLFTEFKGALTENFILQSLIAQFHETPHYWTSGNEAEVDFIIQFQNEIIPIEVKSDEQVKSRSLTLYQQKYHPPFRIRYSLKNLQYKDGLLNIPHFMADYTKELIEMMYKKN